MTLQELFAKDNSWTQGAGARRADGSACQAGAPTATQWCLMGGLTYCYPLGAVPLWVWVRLNELATRGMHYSDLVAWNDAPGRTIDDVRTLVKTAGV